MQPYHVTMKTLSCCKSVSTNETVSLYRNLFSHINLQLTEYVLHSDVFDSIRSSAKVFVAQITFEGKLAQMVHHVLFHGISQCGGELALFAVEVFVSLSPAFVSHNLEKVFVFHHKLFQGGPIQHCATAYQLKTGFSNIQNIVVTFAHFGMHSFAKQIGKLVRLKYLLKVLLL